MNDKRFTSPGSTSLLGSQLQGKAAAKPLLLPERESVLYREIKMPNHKLKRNLLAVGQACFVNYYHLFSDQSLSREAVVDILRSETVYTEQSCISRTAKARRILDAGRGADALHLVVNSQHSRLSWETQQAAESLLSKHRRALEQLLTNRDHQQS